MTNSSTRSKTGYMVNKAPQPGAPMTAAMDADLAIEGEALWREDFNRATLFYQEESVSPMLILTAHDTWTTIPIVAGSSYDYNIGWTVHPGADAIQIHARLAVDSTDAEVRVRAQTSTLVSAVATTTSFDQPAILTGNLNVHGWGGEYRYRVASSTIEITPTLPADRRVVITLQAKITSNSDWLSGTSIEHRIGIYWLRIRDILNTPQPEP